MRFARWNARTRTHDDSEPDDDSYDSDDDDDDGDDDDDDDGRGWGGRRILDLPPEFPPPFLGEARPGNARNNCGKTFGSSAPTTLQLFW